MLNNCTSFTLLARLLMSHFAASYRTRCTVQQNLSTLTSSQKISRAYYDPAQTYCTCHTSLPHAFALAHGAAAHSYTTSDSGLRLQAPNAPCLIIQLPMPRRFTGPLSYSPHVHVALRACTRRFTCPCMQQHLRRDILPQLHSPPVRYAGGPAATEAA